MELMQQLVTASLMTLTIRRLAPADQSSWRALWTAYLKFYKSNVTDEVYTTTFSRLLDPQRPNQNALVAEDGGKLVGFVHFIYHHHNWKLEDVCYLQDLFTVPGYRGQGVGRKLIEAVYEAADGNGTPSVYWMTQEFNSNARHLYDKIGNLTPFIKYQR